MNKRLGYIVTAAALCAPLAALPATPDEEYESLREAYQKLKGDPAKRKYRVNWSKIAARLLAIAEANRDAPVAPRALYTAADLFRELRKVTLSPGDLDTALDLYGRVASEHPGHNLADDALYYKALLLKEVKEDSGAACEVLDTLLSKYATGDMAPKAKTLHEGCPSTGKPPSAVSNQPPAAGLEPQAASFTPQTSVMVKGITCVPEQKGALIIVSLSRPAKFYYEEIRGEPKKGKPPRIYLDIEDASLPADAPKTIPVEKGFVKQVRAAQNRSDLVRIVLDVESIETYSIVAHDSPDRIVMKFGAVSAAALTKAQPPPPSPPEKKDPPAKATGPPVASVAEKKDVPPAKEPAAKEAPATAPSAKEPPPAPPSAKEATPTPAKEAPPPAPPVAAKEGAKEAVAAQDEKAPPMIVAMKEGLKQKIKNGTADTGIPLSEQLGLKFRRIVIDPGHGGDDNGAVGKRKTREKDVTLAIAKKLAARLKDRLKIEVVMTRTDDRTVPLSERAALARAVKADLFISIHANANPNRKFRGIETYYLNNTDDRAAQKVAAMENAVSDKALSDLKMTLLDLALSANVEDSIRLANLIQKSTVEAASAKYGEIKDHGVKYALFYVLFGTEVPSVLVETSFISNPAEEQRLASGKYQDQIAEGIFLGVKKYVGDRKINAQAP